LKIRERQSIKFILLSTFIIVFSFVISDGLLALRDPVERIAGDNRYETAVEIAERQYDYDEVETVIVARGDMAGQYADGLAGNVLAGALDAPILLTAPDTLPEATEEAVDAYDPEELIILGGENAVSREVKYELDVLHTTRIDGHSREETAALIAEKANEEAGLANYAFVVSGTAPADSLVAGPQAVKDNAAILQVMPWRDGIPQVTADMIEELELDKIVVVGGPAVVSYREYDELEYLLEMYAREDDEEDDNDDAVENGENDEGEDEDEDEDEDEVDVEIIRVHGADRYGTSVAMAEKYFEEAEEAIFTGGPDPRLADAMAGGYLAAAKDLPVLYCEESLSEEVEEYFTDIVTITSGAYILGGEAAVSASVADEIRNIIWDEYEEHMFIIDTQYKDMVNLHTIEVRTSGQVHRLQIEGMEMHYEGSNEFSYATTSLTSGADATLEAFDRDGNLLESRTVTLD